MPGEVLDQARAALAARAVVAVAHAHRSGVLAWYAGLARPAAGGGAPERGSPVPSRAPVSVPQTAANDPQESRSISEEVT